MTKGALLDRAGQCICSGAHGGCCHDRGKAGVAQEHAVAAGFCDAVAVQDQAVA